MSLKIPKIAHRMGEIEGAPQGAPSVSREVQISFSSETPYQRHDYERDEPFFEVLGHDAGEVDLTRLNSGGAPLLMDHKATLDSKIGVVVRAWLADGRGLAVVRFADTTAGTEMLERVRSGEVTCVSVGYAVARAERSAAREGGTPVVRVTQWVPKEISFVAIPADPSVGFGRADLDGAPLITVSEKKDGTMPKDTVDDTTQLKQTPAKPAAPAAPETRNDTVNAAEVLASERKRSSEIIAIGQKFNIPEDQTRTALDNGTSVDQFRETVMDHISSDDVDATRAGQARIGLSERETHRFSITNAVRFLMNPTDRNRQAVGFELEASRAVADQLGRESEGLFIPADVLMDHDFARAQNVGTPSQGGVLLSLIHI